MSKLHIPLGDAAEKVATTVAAPSADTLTILHLSDLHFGIEPGGALQESALTQRQLILKALLRRLTDLEDGWRPDVVVVSGDVGWRGHPDDYAQATMWLEKLLEALGLGASRLVLSAGNHDFDRSQSIGRGYTSSAEKADLWLDPAHLEKMGEPFAAYQAFHTAMGVPPLQLGIRESTLVGHRDIEWLRFVVLNTAWFCLDNDDQGHLWIGRPQVESMEASGQLAGRASYDEDPVTVAVLHHPKEWLSPGEIHPYEPRPATYETLARQSHLILHGHVHAGPASPSRVVNGGAWSLVGGATYAGGDYRNHANLVRITRASRNAVVRPIEYDPRSRAWRPLEDEPFSLRGALGDQAMSGETSSAEYSPPDLARLRIQLREHVQRYVESKSRAIAPLSALPDLVAREVAVHGIEERVDTQGERLRLSTMGKRLPLRDVVSGSRPTFLLGDLGSGKSTTVGVHALDIMERDSETASILVPAQYLRGRSLQTVAELASAVSGYVDEQILEGTGDFDLVALLRGGTHAELVLDGLDELKRQEATALLSRAEELNGRYASLRVVATGRPVELRGLDYGRWQVAVVPPLEEEEQRTLLYNEALAEGMANVVAKQDAKQRFDELRSHPELTAVATTPLFVRMLRPHLLKGEAGRTLGELLYDVLLGRLGDWAEREGRSAVDAEFQRRYPDALAREGLVAAVASAVWADDQRGITMGRLRLVLEDVVGDGHEAVAAHASEFMLRSVLVEEGGRVRFPSQPLLECAIGVHIARGGSAGTSVSRGFTAESWRPYSFAAAVAKRKGTLPKIRPRLASLIDEILTSERAAGTPAAAAIVAESRDADLARHFVGALPRLPYRPLRLLAGAEAAASVAVARSLALAGDAGFDWFYNEYLDPSYPLDGSDDRVLTSVVPAWAASVGFAVTPSQRERLVRLVAPHLGAHSMQCHTVLPTIALLIPDAFPVGLRAALYVDALSRGELATLSTERIRELANGADHGSVVAALRAAVSKGLGGPPRRALDLLLELGEGPVEDPTLAAALVMAGPDGRDGLARVGATGPEPYARWCALTDGDKGAAAAAVYLVEKGERRLDVVGPALLKGLHDGGRVEGAEAALEEVVGHAGADGVWWLARQFASSSSLDGAHSGYWRVLLRYVSEWEDGSKVASVLGRVVPHVGRLILPRYAEIRRSLRLLLDRHGAARETLERATWSFSRPVRTGAARVLMACFPESAFRAVDIVIQGAGERSPTAEWLQFCLQLDLGAPVVDHIEQKLDDLAEIPQTFALLLLHQNGRSLDKGQREAIVRGVFGDGFHLRGTMSTSGGGAVLSDEATFDILLDALAGTDEGLHEGAAQALLDSHADRLTIDQRADCWVALDRELSTWTVRRYEAELDPLLSDDEFRDALARATRKRKDASNGGPPLVWVYTQAYQDPQHWADLLWRAVARDSSTSDLEYIGAWLLGRGARDSAVGDVLGQAAVDYLEDPRFAPSGNDYFTAQAVQWMTVLAHEFGGHVDMTALKAALLRSAKDETEVALLARLGATPEPYSPRHPKPYLLAFREAPSPPPSRVKLERALRDGDGLHPQFAAHVEATLLRGEPSDLGALSTATGSGGVFATLVAFCRGEAVSPDWPVWAVTSEAFRTFGPESPTKVSVAFGRALSALLADYDWRRDYIGAVEAGLRANRGKPWSGLRMRQYSELLRAGAELDRALFEGVTEELGNRPYLLSRDLAKVLVDRLAADPAPQDLAEPLLKLGQVLAATSASDREDATGPLQLLVALGLMRLRGEAGPLVTDLYLRGIVEVFVDLPSHWVAQGRVGVSHIRPDPRFPARHVLSLLNPLLRSVRNELVRDCLRQGLESDDPVTRSCCSVLGAFAATH